MNRPTSDPEGKIAELERRLADDPTSTLFLPLGEAYRAAGRSADAERTLRAGLDRHPDHGAARAALGRVLLESGRTDASVLLLEAALAVAPDNVLARRLLDKVRAASPPDWRPAEPPAAEAGRVETTPSPTDELSTVTLAELYLQQGDRERALEIYRERGGRPRGRLRGRGRRSRVPPRIGSTGLGNGGSWPCAVSWARCSVRRTPGLTPYNTFGLCTILVPRRPWANCGPAGRHFDRTGRWW